MPPDQAALPKWKLRFDNAAHGVLRQDLLLGHAASEHPEHSRDWDARGPDTGHAAHLIRIHGDALELGRLISGLASLSQPPVRGANSLKASRRDR
jgi:hypothetical protein